MKLILDLLRWLWQRGQPASENAAPVTDGGDRTSMADFVRILRMVDEEASRRTYPH